MSAALSSSSSSASIASGDDETIIDAMQVLSRICQSPSAIQEMRTERFALALQSFNRASITSTVGQSTHSFSILCFVAAGCDRLIVSSLSRQLQQSHRVHQQAVSELADSRQSSARHAAAMQQMMDRSVFLRCTWCVIVFIIVSEFFICFLLVSFC